MNDAEVKLQVTLDSSTAEKGLSNLNTKTKDLSKSFTSAGKKLTMGLTAPIVAFGAYAVSSASDLEETQSKVAVVFGDSASEVEDWGKTTLKQYGLAEGTALEMASLFGDMATGMGVSQGEASTLSTNLVGLAGDLASFKNISADVTETALAGVFTGETESLKKLGIIMTQTNLEQYALSKGMTKSMDDMTEAEKIQLRYAFVTDRSKNAIGDFANTSDSTANQTRIMTESFKETSAELGKQLLPIVNKVLSKIIDLIAWFNGMDESQKKIVLTILGVLAVLGPLLMFVGSILGAITAITGATWLWNSALLANPITWIIIAIIAFIAIIILLWNKCEWFRNLIMGLWNGLKKGFQIAFDFIKEIFTKVWDVIKGIMDKVKEIFGFVFKIIYTIIKKYVDTYIAIFKGIWTAIKWVIDKIKNGFSAMAEKVKSIFESIKNVVKGIFDGVVNLLKTPLNFIISGLNKIHFTTPDWVPGIGGKSFGINIPKLRVGTDNVNQDEIGRASCRERV